MDVCHLKTIILFCLMASCGPKDNEFDNLTPFSDFEQSYEQHDGRPICSETGNGCASLHTSGSLVKNSFVFKELSVTCTADASGFLVEMHNTASKESASLISSLFIYGVENPSRAYTCKGPEYSQTSPSVLPKIGYCDVHIQIHDTILSATARNECLIIFNNTTPRSGSLYCPQLENTNDYLIVAQESTFSCQP